MRVLHVIPSVSLKQGGPSHAMVLMERALSDVGVRVTTLTTDDDGRKNRLSPELMEGKYSGTQRIYRRKWTEFYKISPGLLVWLFRNVDKYDIVHIHGLFSFANVVAALVSSMKGVPYIVRPLGVLNVYGVRNRRPHLKALSLRFIEGPILARAAAVHFTSRAEAEEAAAATGFSMRETIIPLAVDVPQSFDKNAAPFPIVDRDRVILFLSRIDQKKNLEGLIRAFAQLCRRRGGLHLVVAGSGPDDYERSLRALAVSEGVSDKLTWAGHVDGDTKWAAFAAANIFVLPSFSENFGIAAVEAMAFGLPCVFGNGIGIAREVADKGAALISSTEPADIADAIETILDQPEVAGDLARKASLMAKESFSTNLMAQRLTRLYAQSLRQRN